MAKANKSPAPRVRIKDPCILKLLDTLRGDKGSGYYVLTWHRGKLVDFHRTQESLVDVQRSDVDLVRVV